MGKVKKVTFVVGAGASAEFNFPTGAGLIDKICDSIDLERTAYGLETRDEGLKRFVYNMTREATPKAAQPIYKAALGLRENLPLAPSIDNYIHTHSTSPHVEKLGKYFIAKSILNAEKKSYLRDNNNKGRFERNRLVSRTWLGSLFRIVSAGRVYDDFINSLKNIYFISFNYDRVIEESIRTMAADYFGLGAHEVDRLADAINVYHPYGSLGSVFNGLKDYLPFGGDDGYVDVEPILGRVRTFTEGSESDGVEQVDHAFDGTSAIFFVGFGFIPLNMKLLFRDGRKDLPRSYGTVCGLSDDNISHVSEELMRLDLVQLKSLKPKPVLVRDRAADFIEGHSRRIGELIGAL